MLEKRKLMSTDMRRMSSTMRLCLGGRTFFLVCAALLCGCNNKSDDMHDRLAGIWARQVEGGPLVEMHLYRSGGYYVAQSGMVHIFPGSCEISGDVARFVDLYCGTSLPGLYRICIKKERDNEILAFELELLEDETCKRNDLFPGIWERRDKAKLIEDAEDPRITDKDDLRNGNKASLTPGAES